MSWGAVAMNLRIMRRAGAERRFAPGLDIATR